MRRLGNIWDGVCSMDNLREAHGNARRDKSHYSEVKMVDSDPDRYLGEIREMLVNRSYRVSEYRIQHINDRGKEREIWKLPYFPDRIIQWALMLHLREMFERNLVAWSCASLPGRGIHRAAGCMRRYLEDTDATRYCLKMDVRKYYPSIDQETLKRMLRRKVKDGGALWLLDLVIDSTPSGVPIGSYLSQYLGNFYLSPLDHMMCERWGFAKCVRYMDDIVVLDGSKKRLHGLRRKVDEYLRDELKLQLKGNWQVFPVDARGVDFVGYRFFHGYTLLRDSTKRRMVRKMRDFDALAEGARSTVAAYDGWLRWCDADRLRRKWVEPNALALDTMEAA